VEQGFASFISTVTPTRICFTGQQRQIAAEIPVGSCVSNGHQTLDQRKPLQTFILPQSKSWFRETTAFLSWALAQVDAS
jgi:hypothetical protein